MSETDYCISEVIATMKLSGMELNNDEIRLLQKYKNSSLEEREQIRKNIIDSFQEK